MSVLGYVGLWLIVCAVAIRALARGGVRAGLDGIARARFVAVVLLAIGIALPMAGAALH